MSDWTPITPMAKGDRVNYNGKDVTIGDTYPDPNPLKGLPTRTPYLVDYLLVSYLRHKPIEPQ